MNKRSYRRILHHFGIAVAASLLLAASVSAQLAGGLSETTPTNLGGKHFISGTVFTPSGTPLRARTRIRLASMNGEIVTTTDDTGKFIFSGISNGLYTVFVDEDNEYETALSTLEVAERRGGLGQNFTIFLRLRAKDSKLKKPEVISAANAGVPKAAAAQYTKAIELAQKGDHQGAIEQLKLAVAAYPQYMLAHSELGVQHIKIGKLEEADTHFLAALKIKPDAYEPLVNRGILLVRLKRFADADAELRKALAVNETAIVHYYLGRTAIGLQKLDDAEKELLRSIELGGDEVKEAHRMLANVYLEKGDDKRALESLETYLKLVPNAPDAEKLREAVSQLKKAVAQNP
jgi:tetratricopeptide (TPR) repeat protein